MTTHTASQDTGATLLQRRWTLIVRAVLAGGILLVAAGVLLNPFFVATFVSGDGELERQTIRRIYLVDALFLVIGGLLIVASRALKTRNRRKERLVVRVLVLAASVVVMLAVFEGMLRLSDRYFRPISRQRHYFYEYDPLLGWRHKPGTSCLFKGTNVSINAAGLRDTEIPYENRTGEFRILFLGDSQLFGDGVPAEHTIAQALQRRLTNALTINSGVIGYGTDQQLLYLQKYGHRFQPNLTVVVTNAYDLQDNIRDTIRSGYRKPLYRLRDDKIELTNVPVPRLDVSTRLHRRLGQWSNLYYLVSKKLSDSRTASPRRSESPQTKRVYPPPEKIRMATDITLRLFAEIARENSNDGVPTVVLFLPYAMDFAGDRQYQQNTERFLAALSIASGEDDYVLLDMREPLKQTATNDSYLDTMHFSAAGAEIVGSAILDGLLQRDLLPRHHVAGNDTRPRSVVGGDSNDRNRLLSRRVDAK